MVIENELHSLASMLLTENQSNYTFYVYIYITAVMHMKVIF